MCGNNVLCRLDECEADVHGLVWMRNKELRFCDGVGGPKKACRRRSAATLTVAGVICMRAANRPVRIRLNSTTLHE